MEAKFTNLLRQYGFARSTLIELCQKATPRSILENNTVFHSLLVFTSLTVTISVFAATRSLTLFSLHPIMMTIGCLLFLGEGLVSFRNSSLVDMLSPIMQHNKKSKVKALHQTMQTLGSCFLLLGTIFIVAHKARQQLPMVSLSAHAIVGLTALVFISGQCISGIQKLQQQQPPGRKNTNSVDTCSCGGGPSITNSSNHVNNTRKIHRWHGEAGLLTWDLLCISIFLGLIRFQYILLYNSNNAALPASTATSPTLRVSFTSIFVLLSVCASWLLVHMHVGSSRSRYAPMRGSTGSSHDHDGVLVHLHTNTAEEHFSNGSANSYNNVGTGQVIAFSGIDNRSTTDCDGVDDSNESFSDARGF